VSERVSSLRYRSNSEGKARKYRVELRTYTTDACDIGADRMGFFDP